MNENKELLVWIFDVSSLNILLEEHNFAGWAIAIAFHLCLPEYRVRKNIVSDKPRNESCAFAENIVLPATWIMHQIFYRKVFSADPDGLKSDKSVLPNNEHRRHRYSKNLYIGLMNLPAEYEIHFKLSGKM